jgi:diadenosine tetraphosphate (Ap4A) HIT family hydrolase
MAIDETCLFCKISTGMISTRKIWENSTHMAVLTPFPYSAGFTVLFPKNHLPSDILQLPYEDISPLIKASQEVSKLLRDRLNLVRVGLIFEGYGINHAHVKLIPMHGISNDGWKQISSSENARIFYEKYPGFIASHDGPQMEAIKLDYIHRMIIE